MVWSYFRVTESILASSVGPNVVLSLLAGCERRLNRADERRHQAKPDADFGGGCDTHGLIFFSVVLHQFMKADLCINYSSDSHQGAVFNLNSYHLFFYLVRL